MDLRFSEHFYVFFSFLFSTIKTSYPVSQARVVDSSNNIFINYEVPNFDIEIDVSASPIS